MFNPAVRRRLLDANTLRGGCDNGSVPKRPSSSSWSSRKVTRARSVRSPGRVVAVNTHEALGGSREVGVVGTGQAIG
jgi:hypothetical protein